MITIYTETQVDACQKLWEEYIDCEHVMNLWHVRMSFHQHFKRALFFVVAKDGDKVVGLIPMSFIEEHSYYGYFPGETWHGKTWLEQNQIFAQDQSVLQAMLAWLDDNKISYHLRYLQGDRLASDDAFHEDETGYYFYPPAYDFSMDQYYATFQWKKIKAVHKEIQKMHERGLVIRYDNPDDFDLLIKMNTERFGSDSYFADPLFVASFKSLTDYLQANQLLKMTTVLIDGHVAAIDMGSLVNGTYTLLAGGTNKEFPGIAKLINLHHMEIACQNKYAAVDFLCGDFSWKTMFHLEPRILYAVSNICTDAKDEEGI